MHCRILLSGRKIHKSLGKYFFTRHLNIIPVTVLPPFRNTWSMSVGGLQCHGKNLCAASPGSYFVSHISTFFQTKRVGIANFNRFWATWKITSKSIRMPLLHGALQLFFLPGISWCFGHQYLEYFWLWLWAWKSWKLTDIYYLNRFDELHLGQFTNFLVNSKYFFDANPPLGKLLYAATGMSLWNHSRRSW